MGDLTSNVFGKNKMSVHAFKSGNTSCIYNYGKFAVKPQMRLTIRHGDIVRLCLDFETQTITFFHGDRPGIITHESIPCDQVYIPAVSLMSKQYVECIAWHTVYD